MGSVRKKVCKILASFYRLGNLLAVAATITINRNVEGGGGKSFELLWCVHTDCVDGLVTTIEFKYNLSTGNQGKTKVSEKNACYMHACVHAYQAVSHALVSHAGRLDA